MEVCKGQSNSINCGPRPSLTVDIESLDLLSEYCRFASVLGRIHR
jgi:hypothetical protein